MNKKRAIDIITKAAELYRDNLEDQQLLFVYGIPAEIGQQLKMERNSAVGFDFYEVLFLRNNFMHLTGIKVNSKRIKSSINFYEKCLAHRLSEKDFEFAKDGSTEQKLDVLCQMMRIKNNVSMIGDFTDRGPRLYSEKIAGNIFACMGFVKDKYTSSNVPNTLLKKDIRDISSKPQQKVYIVFSKKVNEDKYSFVEKVDKKINILEVIFPPMISEKIKILSNADKTETNMKYGLLGEKLGHSFSPVLHGQMGKPDYGLIPVSKEEVDAFLAKADFEGINVTIPYKEVAMKYCQPDEIASDIGCVNTLLNMGDKVLGFNTDCLGFAYIAKSIGTEWKDKKVVVLGSGGTSKTATYVALKSGAKSVTVVSRTKGSEEEAKPYMTEGQHVYKSDYEHSDDWKDATILINTTPVGMYPNNDAMPIDLDVFEKLEAVIDVIYNPLDTYLVMDAKKRGIPATCGLAMLVAQGWYGEEIWKNANDLSKVDLSIDGKLSDDAIAEIERVVKFVRNQKENIVLIGMPGSGKTTLGKLLEKRLNRKFVDTDDAFTERFGMKAGDYITAYGVDEFREKESIIVKEAAKESGTIIATGGGAVLREDNREALRQNGRIVLLNQKLELLATEGRPLSAGDGLKKLYEERMPIYNAFKDIALDVVLDDFEANVDNLLEML